MAPLYAKRYTTPLVAVLLMLNVRLSDPVDVRFRMAIEWEAFTDETEVQPVADHVLPFVLDTQMATMKSPIAKPVGLEGVKAVADEFQDWVLSTYVGEVYSFFAARSMGAI